MGFVNESEFAPHSLFVSSNDKSSSSWNVTESYCWCVQRQYGCYLNLLCLQCINPVFLIRSITIICHSAKSFYFHGEHVNDQHTEDIHLADYKSVIPLLVDSSCHVWEHERPRSLQNMIPLQNRNTYPVFNSFYSTVSVDSWSIGKKSFHGRRFPRGMLSCNVQGHFDLSMAYRIQEDMLNVLHH